MQTTTNWVRGVAAISIDEGLRKGIQSCSSPIEPSREEKLLSDHVFSIFGRTLTITGYEQLITGAIVVIVLTAWAVQQFRRKRTVVVQPSVVSDQVVYELSRIAEALDLIANSPADEAVSPEHFKSPPPQ